MKMRLRSVTVASILLCGCVYTPLPITTFENGIVRRLSALERDPAWSKDFDIGPNQSRSVNTTESTSTPFEGQVVLSVVDKKQRVVAQTVEAELPTKTVEEALELRKKTGTGDCTYTIQYEYRDGKWKASKIRAEQTTLDGGYLTQTPPDWIGRLDFGR
jgi:hypothetical protein